MDKSAQDVIQRLQNLTDPARAAHSQRFFKTGPGEYAEGDCFLGITVPLIRKLLKEYKALELQSVKELLDSSFHEARFFALIYLRREYERAGCLEQKDIFRCFSEKIDRINNWDLVDISAPYISGHHYYENSRKGLYQLVNSTSLWHRRIAIMSTFYFIRQQDYEVPLEFSRQLLNDQQDLMHKAVGWMLREIGKRDKSVECEFLDRWALSMPRTMLRYAIEKFPQQERLHYMKLSLPN